MAAADESIDIEGVREIYRKVTALLQEDQPVTFLYPQVWTTVAHRRVKWLSEPYRTDPIWHPNEVWIEE